MTLYRGFAAVGAMTVVSRVLGFLRDMLIAAVLGAGPAADAFFVAFRVPNLFRRLFAEGAFDAAFVPLFAKRLHGEGEEPARDFAEQALSVLALALAALTLIAELAMPWLILVLAPGFARDPAKFELTVLLARIALPYLVSMALVVLYSGMLNALGRFALAVFTPSLLNLVLILVLLAIKLLGGIGATRASEALAWGITAAGLLQVAFVALAVVRTAGLRLSLKRPRLSPEMRRLLLLLAPGMLAGGMAQLTVVLNTVIASLQDRVVSWLYYADRLFQLPLGIIGAAIGIVLLPDLSRKLRAGDSGAVVASENRALEFALLLTLPAAVALFLAAGPIVRVLFEHGAFTAVDADAIAGMLVVFAAGVPAFVLIKVLHPSFFAREDTKTPMLFAGLAMAANLMLSLVLFVLFGARGIAVATTAAAWLHVALLARTLRAREEFVLDALFRRRLMGTIAASLVMGAVVWVLVRLLAPWFDPAGGLAVQGTALAFLVAAGLGTYVVAAELFGAVKLKAVLASLTSPASPDKSLS
jgi:putative peptidoglycan lipid II flippase